VEERGDGGVNHDFSGVEISIAGGAEEMVRANYCDCFSFLFATSMFVLLGYKDCLYFIDMAGKNPFPLTAGNIQTPKSLWYGTNHTSRLPPI